ncbi:tyrosine-type recombinase/integrase [Myroides odoratimimus]|uniref:tyrosine-type recombinase/integrase n=1 Tax=Myroides odoratimimus TaxID=76832 RepID=UPI00257830DD|nr:tyrosine-type recombinase/integrase [Myroides odoratimimus]MDM1415055.1 tyrosine-type recombinase/integrase [Myroides odoratimimus]
MSAVTFSYRSTKEKAPLEVRLSFRIDGSKNPYSFYCRSKIIVEKVYWKNLHTKTDFPNYRDIDKQNEVKEIKNKQFAINEEIENIRTHILTAFDLVPSDEVLKVVNKKWLEYQIDIYYNPPKTEEEEEQAKIPTDLISYIDYYLDYRKHEISESLRKKNNVVKNKLIRFQKERKKTILIKDVNDKFKQEFVSYQKKHSYSQNTMQRELVFIKTFCRHASFVGLETHPQMEGLRIDREKVTPIYLTFEEIEQIKETNNLPEYLDNARDWLIISCYMGQRVSDFMRFKKDMIRIENNGMFLEFTQIKTKKEMTVPIHPKVIEILEKRNGDFPRQISDVNYNLYIKEVCQRAGLTQIVSGSKKVETAPKSKQYRKVSGEFPKYELITSHIGRRSFATNFYGKIPTTYLIYTTGHSSEAMFLAYIGKSNKDLAKETNNYFKNLG